MNKPELFIGFAKNKKVGSLMNVCFIISTKTKSALFLNLKKGKVSLQTAEMQYLFLSM